MRYLVVAILAGLLVYLGRGVWTPFVLAAVVAFIFNPLVDFLAHKIKLPRTISIVVIYFIIIGFITITAFMLGAKIGEETREFSREANFYLRDAGAQIKILPEWLQLVAFDVFDSARQSLLFPTRRMVNFLPGALNRSISVLVFLVATFYFLKDGQELKKSFLALFSKNIHDQLEIISQKINKVLGDYLRGQILLVIIMTVLTYLGLQIVGVRYALILSIFTGFAEIIPFVGPLAAVGVAALMAFTDGYSRISPSPLVDAATVGSLYLILRQLEDLFIIPQIMGKVTKLHPLVIIVATFFGGHVFGILGYLLAVPVVASLKVVFDHYKTLQDE